MKINVKVFAIATALWWGIGLFALTWWMILFQGPTSEPTLIGRVYRGYTVSPLGSLIGLAWGLVDGLIGGAMLAWLYNVVSRFFSRSGQAQRPHPRSFGDPGYKLAWSLSRNGGESGRYDRGDVLLADPAAASVVRADKCEIPIGLSLPNKLAFAQIE